MTWGLSAANLANAWLATMRGGGAGTTFTAPAALYDQLHIGDPGAAGTANPSTTTTRQLAAWGVPASGSMALTTQPAWTSWAGSAETLAGVSTWSAATTGTFYHSTPFTTSRPVNPGDTVTVVSHSFALGPIAA